MNSIRTPLALGLTAAAFACAAVAANEATPEVTHQKMERLESAAPYRGYLKAHESVHDPLEILGGPLKISVSQSEGSVYIALPDHRELDPAVFGRPGRPRAREGFPGIEGVPLDMRGTEDGKYTEFEDKSPFGNARVVMSKGRLDINAKDITATDAATTEDEVEMEASWEDKDGNEYKIKCCEEMASHGADFPTFGGVVTGHILYGSSRGGTPLMPTEYAWFAFWGTGKVFKNGELMDGKRLVHGVLSEGIRTDGYQLAFDDEVEPTEIMFHLIVPPVDPKPEKGTYEKDPVHTGYKLDDGKELPFWHVIFMKPEVTAARAREKARLK